MERPVAAPWDIPHGKVALAPIARVWKVPRPARLIVPGNPVIQQSGQIIHGHNQSVDALAAKALQENTDLTMPSSSWNWAVGTEMTSAAITATIDRLIMKLSLPFLS